MANKSPTTLSSGLAGNTNFPDTNWQSILRVARNETMHAAQHLSDFSQHYWLPLYSFLRRSGLSRENAQDSVQGFFVHLLEHDIFQHANKERGKFRSFLLTCLKHYVSDQRDKANAIKRGGKASHFSLDVEYAEGHLSEVEQESPEGAYDRAWALSLLEQSLMVLRQELSAKGKGKLFELARPCLDGTHDTDYATRAAQLAITEANFRTQIHRMRKRIGQILRQLIADTVEDAADVDQELQYMMEALG